MSATPAQAIAADNTVHDPLRVLGLLNRLARERVLLSVSSEVHKGFNPSLLLSASLTTSHLLLDAFPSADAHRLVGPGLRLTVDALLEHIPVRFRGVVLDVLDERGGEVYRVSLPATVERRQRRAHFRAPAALRQPVEVTVLREETPVGTGVLRDLSRGGLSLRLRPGAELEVPGTEPQPLACTLHLPGADPLVAPIQVVRAQGPDVRGELLVGARFLQLEVPDARTLRRFVALLERELARKRPRRTR